MKEISLTKSQVAIVDDWNYDFLNQWKWYATLDKSTNSYRAVRVGKRDENGKQERIVMARVVAKTPPGLQADHINHNTLDNRECNLRNVTRSQNIMNRGVQRVNKLQEKCIHEYRVLGYRYYRVRVKKDKSIVYDKSFKTLESAIAARDEAVEKFHGEYAFIK